MLKVDKTKGDSVQSTQNYNFKIEMILSNVDHRTFFLHVIMSSGIFGQLTMTFIKVVGIHIETSA